MKSEGMESEMRAEDTEIEIETNKQQECWWKCARKLALFHTPTFKPLMSHADLQPIMASLGFVHYPSSRTGYITWIEYLYSGEGRSQRELLMTEQQQQQRPRPPKPELPFPVIDGLHICTYMGFLDAVNFYLRMNDISLLFHVRGMPLCKTRDRSTNWQCIEKDDGVFQHREEALDCDNYNFYQENRDGIDFESNKSNISVAIRSKGNDTPTLNFVPLSDIIPDHETRPAARYRYIYTNKANAILIRF